MIRLLEERDIEALVAEGKHFFRYSGLEHIVSYVPEAVELTLRAALQGRSDIVVFVAEIEGRIIGAIGGIISAPYYAPTENIAREFIWWISRAHRNTGAGIRLLHRFESWARTIGAQAIILNTAVLDGDCADNVLSRQGYVCFEHSYIRNVGG